MNLQEIFLGTAGKFSTDQKQLHVLWDEIADAYSDSGRHYHSLQHLENLYGELSAIRSEISNWDAVVFALFYHDVVSSSIRQNNEEKSAELAEQRLSSIEVPKSIIELCVQHILATKSHSVSDNNDTNLFTDADLSILGAPLDSYVHYYKQIRKEYSIYPDLMYNPGRKKVLQHFLGMHRIFKTDYFYGKYEVQARKNIAAELNELR